MSVNGSHQNTYRRSVDICFSTCCHFCRPARAAILAKCPLYIGRFVTVKEYYILKPRNLTGAQAPLAPL